MPKQSTNESPASSREEQEKDAGKQTPEQFESDTERIIHRHLENKDDIITDEDIASVRVGMTPEFDEVTEERFDEDGLEEAGNEETPASDNIADNEDPITPMDTIKP